LKNSVIKTIVITSGKSGAGKTSVSVNTALEISRRNLRTCLLNASPTAYNDGNTPKSRQIPTLNDFISGKKPLDEIIFHSDNGIDVIVGSSAIARMANLKRKKITDLISSFSRLPDYDYFLIDTSSRISKEVVAFSLASSETILIITSDPASHARAYAFLRILSFSGHRRKVKILVNRCSSMPKSKRIYLRFKSAIDKHINILIEPVGTILNDTNITVAANQQKPVTSLFPNSIASQCFRTMVSTLLEKDTKDSKIADLGKFWQHYFDLLHSDLSFPGVPYPDSDTKPSGLTTSRKNSRLISPEERPIPFNLSQKQISPFSHHAGIIDPCNLPSPVPLLSKFLELQARGELPEKIILQMISSDPALMIKAMRLYCSPGCLDSNRVTRLVQITRKLGTDVLHNLIVTTSTQRALLHSNPPDTNFVNAFWCHSYRSALLAEQLAKKSGYPFPEEAFLVGLIHDIGRLALQTSYPEIYTQFPHTLYHKKSVAKAEKYTFGLTHAEIGARTLQAWNLNSFIVDTVHYHLEPVSRIVTGFDLMKIVFLACRMTQSTARQISLSRFEKSLLGLTSVQLLACIETAEKKLKKTASFFHMVFPEEKRKNQIEKSDPSLRQYIADYSIVRSALPNQRQMKEFPQIIRQIHQGLDILFGIKVALCLVVNSQQSSLHAVGYPDCTGWKLLLNISISLKTEKSPIIQSFTTGKLKISMNDDGGSKLSLADEQVMRILNSAGIISIPMIAYGVTVGVLVLGIQKEELRSVQKQQNRLEQFVVRSAKNIYASVHPPTARRIQ